MMNSKRATGVLAFAVLGLVMSGCTASPSNPHPTPNPSQLVPDVRANSTDSAALSSASDDQITRVAYTVCQAFDEEAKKNEVMATMIGDGLDATSSRTIMKYAVIDLCPKYQAMIE